jgi:hypothetical protein
MRARETRAKITPNVDVRHYGGKVEVYGHGGGDELSSARLRGWCVARVVKTRASTWERSWFRFRKLKSHSIVQRGR